MVIRSYILKTVAAGHVTEKQQVNKIYHLIYHLSMASVPINRNQLFVPFNAIRITVDKYILISSSLCGNAMVACYWVRLRH